MDKHAFPRELFPSSERLLSWSKSGSWGADLHALRSRAVEHYAVYAQPDKELERFISPALSLKEELPSLKTSPLESISLGSGVWLADFERMPFYPPELALLCDQLFLQPFSIAHYGLATFTRFQLLFVPPDTRFSQPITFSLEQGLEEQGAEVLVFMVGAGSSLTLTIDAFIKQGSMTRVLLGFCGEDSSVTVVTQSTYGPHAVGLNHELWHTAPRSSLNTLFSAKGGLQVWNKRDYYLEAYASVTHRAVSALKDNEQEVLITRQIHKGAHSTSSVLAKSALGGTARSFYRGTILIDENARFSEARQKQKALMLDSSARVCALPTLEVATSQVSCSHGSAAGGFNDEQVTYLSSRGLSSEQVYGLLLEGFFQDEAGEFNDILKTVAHSLQSRYALNNSL